MFNENTVYWASSWVTPYAIARPHGAAARASREIEQLSTGSLLTIERLNAIARTHYEIARPSPT